MKAFLLTAAVVVVGLFLFPRLTIMGLILWGLAVYLYHLIWSY
jgi:hypothetical protein